MKQLYVIFVLIIIIFNIYCSPCTTTYLNNNPTTSDEVDTNSDGTATNSDSTATNSDGTATNYDSTAENSVSTAENSDSTAENSDSTAENSDSTAENSDSTATNSDSTTESSIEARRIRILLSDNDCEVLKTSDDDKFKCVLNKEKQICEEVEKESFSNILTIPFTIICLILFF